jgi:hypothetical protein
MLNLLEDFLEQGMMTLAIGKYIGRLFILNHL